MGYKDRECEVVVRTWKDGDGWGRTQTYWCPNLDAARNLRAIERQKDPKAYVFIRDADTLRLCG
jgi:hypothetical protein